MASWKSIEQFVVPQGIAETSTTAKLPLGQIVRARHEDYGAGEFIYLTGVVGTVAGSWVVYNSDAFTTALIAGNAIGPVAVSMSANVASQYGFYQIAGEALANAADVADSGRVYIDTVPGRCDDALVAGDRVKNAKWTSADDTAAVPKATVMLNRPFVEDMNDS